MTCSDVKDVLQNVCATAFHNIFFRLQLTIFQVTQNPGQPQNFPFAVDGFLQNLTVYITGLSSQTFSLINPVGDVAEFTFGHLSCRCSNTFPPCQVLHYRILVDQH